MIPFAVVGSERTVIIDGKQVRGRKNRWGVVNVEDERHCEFVHLRNFLTRYVAIPPATEPLTHDDLGRTCRTSSRRLHRSTTRPSAQNNCSHSRSRPTRARPRQRSERAKAKCVCRSRLTPVSFMLVGLGERLDTPFVGFHLPFSLPSPFPCPRRYVRTLVASFGCPIVRTPPYSAPISVVSILQLASVPLRSFIIADLRGLTVYSPVCSGHRQLRLRCQCKASSHVPTP